MEEVFIAQKQDRLNAVQKDQQSEKQITLGIYFRTIRHFRSNFVHLIVEILFFSQGCHLEVLRQLLWRMLPNAGVCVSCHQFFFLKKLSKPGLFLFIFILFTWQI